MAITLTQVQLSAAIRLGDSTEETAEATRLLGYVTAAVTQHLGTSYEAAPEAVVNEAAIRLAGYLFDMPNAGRGLSYANAGRNSGAWAILLPFRVHRAGSTGAAVSAAQEAVGSPGNPVTNVAISGGNLVVTFDDGTSESTPFTPGAGDGTDQAARDAAAAAQATGDGATTAAAAAQSDIDAHEANHPSGGAGVDQTARDAAAAAQGTANNAATAATAAADTASANTGRLDAFPAGTGGVDQTARDAADGAQGTADGAQTAADAAQADIDAHEGTPHNHDTTARDAAAAQAAADAAQADLDTHEGTPHNHDATARAAAATAQARADDAYTLADGKVDSSGAASAARDVVADWAEDENLDPIPAPKLVNVVNAHEDIVNVLDGRLPGLPVVMRLGWSQRAEFLAADFARPSPPIGGSIAGMSGGLAAPPFPPALASDPTLFLGIWLAGDPDVVEISGGGAQFGNKRPLTIDAGKVGGNPGVYLVSTGRLRPLEGTIFRVTITGPRIVTESDLAAHVSDPDAHHTPPADPGPGGSDLEVSTAEIRFLRSTPLVEIDSQQFTNAVWSNLQRDGADVVCPTTGQIEFFMHAKTGGRDNSVAYARIPASELRATPTDGEMQVALGANRWLGIRTSSLLDQEIQVKGQDGQTSVDGNYSVRMSHIEEVTATFVTGVTGGGGGA